MYAGETKQVVQSVGPLKLPYIMQTDRISLLTKTDPWKDFRTLWTDYDQNRSCTSYPPLLLR